MVELVTKEEEESGAERSGRSQSVAVEEDGTNCFFDDD